MNSIYVICIYIINNKLIIVNLNDYFNYKLNIIIINQ